jgi:hypothetical protein
MYSLAVVSALLRLTKPAYRPMTNQRTGYQSSEEVQMFKRAGVGIALDLWQQSRDLATPHLKGALQR